MPRPPVPRPFPAPPPPGGSALRRRRESAAQRAAQLPVSNETSAGGIALKIIDGVAFAACIGRRNRAGKPGVVPPEGPH
ncbi:hypothetical protein GCM10025876_19780 [Demequina litorisediminis]|uniref:Uncharacterized protein n=1 Tax=Demequina litorisediminis TaxID=1849022 RepID=A0ABQ6IGC9_9MICO|nr:hypothetical protein GCM10025876_19780 [Demequina litorisediminis]